jgi:hypothetical protein
LVDRPPLVKSVQRPLDVPDGENIMTLSNRRHPSNPMWNCCQEAPAFVGEYADGSATVICAKDAHHFRNGAEGKSLHELPKDWKPATPEDQRVKLAEAALSMYQSFAYSDDSSYAGSWTNNYTNAVFTLKACIINAYGDELKSAGLDVDDIYSLLIDCGESVAYCVKYALEHPEIHPFRV